VRGAIERGSPYSIRQQHARQEPHKICDYFRSQFAQANVAGEDFLFELRNCAGLPNPRSNSSFDCHDTPCLAFCLEREALAAYLHAIAKWKRPAGHGVTSEGTFGPAQTVSFNAPNVIGAGGDVRLDLRD
jgi:hypothetical protein